MGNVMWLTAPRFSDVTFQYPGAPLAIFRHLNLAFTNDCRICITGQNGQGKSTILKLLLGDLEPNAGEITVHPRLRIGRFSQHHIDMLDMNLTCVEFLRKQFPGATDMEYRAHLGRYGLSGDTGLQAIHTLSGALLRPLFSPISIMLTPAAVRRWPKEPHGVCLDELHQPPDDAS